MKKALSIILASVMVLSLLTACGGKEEGNSSTPAADDGKTYTLIAAYAVAEDPNSQHTTRFNKLKELVEEPDERQSHY